MAVFTNEKGEIIYDSEDFTGRLRRATEQFQKLGLFTAPKLPVLTREDYAEMKKGPLMVLDSFAGMP
ncbi:hypothetical protein [Burkholderia phage FLC9]|nr:hypothetical protein [Burkholderia phage FLC9]